MIADGKRGEQFVRTVIGSFFLSLLLFVTPILAQAPPPVSPVFGNNPVPAINVQNFGAVADAQVAQSPTTCTMASGSGTLVCNAGLFTPADLGKWAEVPGAGPATSSPAPHSTLLGQILQIGNLDTNGKDKNAVLSVMAMTTLTTGVPITWGTDNSLAFQAAVDKCPPPSNSTVSKGCVLFVPDPGAGGTGDYMFGSGVVFNNQTSFEILAMGNSSKAEASGQAGVRFLTAMPITILTVSLTPVGGVIPANFAGFRMENITFRDTSANGSALGGLLMQNVSEAVIAYCNFENFNGQTADSAGSGVNHLAYGMKSDPAGGTNNNIVLIHDKGENNMVWYDSSLPFQDGPIVIGGDVFPGITAFPTPNTGFTGACFGIIAQGPLRLYGTHFDTAVNGNDTTHSTPACYGVNLLQGGIVSGKFESSTQNGNGILLQGGERDSTPITISGNNATVTSAGLVTISSTTNTMSPGQLVRMSFDSRDAAFIGGTYLVLTGPGSGGGTSFTYEQKAGSAGTTGFQAMATGITASGVEVDAILSNTITGIDIQGGSSNNKATALVAGSGVTTPVSDAGTNDLVQVLGFSPGTSTKITGAFTPASSGGTDVGSTSLPFGNIWTNNLKLNGNTVTASAGSATVTVPATTDTLVARTTTDTLKNKTLQGASSGNAVTLLSYQKSAAAITGNGSFQSLYTFSIPGGTLGAGKCIHAIVSFQHTTGTAMTSYKWVVGGTAGTTLGPTNNTGLAFDDFYFCNDPGQTAQNALITRTATLGNAFGVGGLVTNGTENTANTLSLSFQFSVPSPDAVTPEMFEVLLDQ